MEQTGVCFSMLLFVLVAMAATSVQGQGTRVGFYSRTCPRVESIVRSTVESHFRSDPTVAPGLLRMHFHDCFVNGCDASILIDGSNTEKTAVPNLQLKGFDVIDDVKSKLEAECPGIVSCADILALAARDSVVLTRGLTWTVPTGRRDGTVSLASDTANLPGFTDSVDVQKQKFTDKGLNTQDLVVLVGGHTIGTAGCAVIVNRLFNFNGTVGASDPSISPSFLPTLKALCPQNGNPGKRVALDTGSVSRFDTSFFTNLRDGKGVIQSDQVLWTDASTRTIAQRFLGIRGILGLTFNVEFGRSMIKMSNIGVKTGTQGEIRRVCTAIN